MKFIAGMITSTIFIAIVFIGCWLYFDFPISTNDEKQAEQQTQEIQQEEIQNEKQDDNRIQEQQAPATIPSHEKTPNEVDESQQRKSEIQALQENDKAQDWKEQYNKTNEGTDENPYVMIDGKPVDPRHLTGKENN